MSQMFRDPDVLICYMVEINSSCTTFIFCKKDCLNVFKNCSYNFNKLQTGENFTARLFEIGTNIEPSTVCSSYTDTSTHIHI